MELASVIKYEGDNKSFIWKHPCEDFNSMSQLIVHESQEAVLFIDGKIAKVYKSGRYTLETKNIPFLRKLISLPLGDNTPFHCEIYFVNKTTQMAIRWGTDSKLEYMDPIYNFPIKLGANGEMVLKVSDSEKLLIHLVGTENIFDQSHITTYFRAFLLMRIKSYIARIMRENKLDIFQLDEKILAFSQELQKLLTNDFAEYGISLVKFLVTGIVKPDGDAVYEKFKLLHFRQYADIADAKIRQQVGLIDQQTASQRMVINAQGLSEKRKIEGYTYQEERQFNVAEKVAENSGVGEFSNAGIGIGMMAGVGNMIGQNVTGMIGQVLSPQNTPPAATQSQQIKKYCPHCGKEILNTAKFCAFCGSKISNPKKCPKCDYVLEENWKYCPACGWRNPIQ